MNLILIDYDLLNQAGRIKDFFEKEEDCRVYSIKDAIMADFSADVPIKGIVLTALNSGWMKYHTEIAEQYPFVNHWIFCVVGMEGTALQKSVARQFKGGVDSGVYCELVFDDDTFSVIAQKLKEPVKKGKKCLVVSLNADLAEEVREIVQMYLPDWSVETATAPTPDYTLCDSVFVVGNTSEDMVVARPEVRSVKVCFWMNTPYFKNQTDSSVDRASLGRQLNEAGWNIGDYSSLVFFSSIHHEQVYQQICCKEMTPAALLADPQFVLWDDYGLPLVQSRLEEQAMLSFLSSHTIFQKMTDRFCNNQKSIPIENEI